MAYNPAGSISFFRWQREVGCKNWSIEKEAEDSLVDQVIQARKDNRAKYRRNDRQQTHEFVAGIDQSRLIAKKHSDSI